MFIDIWFSEPYVYKYLGLFGLASHMFIDIWVTEPYVYIYLVSKPCL